MLYSIITVCYNNFQGLLQTYESVNNQSYKDYEWVIVDGGSTDGTLKWLKGLRAKNIKWVSERDKGIFDAMNKGIDMAKGQYLLFLNSGDCFASNTILEQVKEFASEKIHFIYGDSVDVKFTQDILYRESKPYNTLYRGMFTSHQAMFFRSSLLAGQKYNWKEYPVTADYAFIAEFLSKCNEENIKYLNIPFCRFLLGGTNEKFRFKALHEDFRIRRNIFRISWAIAGVLYSLHFLHTLLKRRAPLLMQRIRYREIKPNGL
jgi:putative colanic acid biosynthesis glycosyltransferase